MAVAAAKGGGDARGAAGAVAAPPRALRGAVSCLMSPERVADIGAPVIGVVSAMHVDTGDTVRAGQVLVSLRDEVEHAGERVAEVRARIDADERAAAANLELTTQKLDRSVQLEQQGFVSSQATEQAKAEREVARQKLEQARAQRKVAQRELEVVRAQRGQRTVKSPFAGVVVDRFANVAERVEDKPMVRVAMLDPLRVELVVPANRWGGVAVDDNIEVSPELPGATPVRARVTKVDRVIDGASNTFRVRLALPNPGHRLPSGARCKVQWPGDANDTTAGTTQPAPVAARTKRTS